METEKKGTGIRQGVCPTCGSENLNYETILDTGGIESVCYPFTCDDCDFTGKEVYVLSFSGYYNTKTDEWLAL